MQKQYSTISKLLTGGSRQYELLHETGQQEIKLKNKKIDYHRHSELSPRRPRHQESEDESVE